MSVIFSISSSVRTIPVLWSIVAAALAAWVWFRIKYRRYIELGDKLPGPLSLPLIGCLYFLIPAYNFKVTDIFNEFWERIEEFMLGDGIARLWVGPRLVVGIFNPADAEVLLSSTVHLTKPPEYGCFQPWFGDGLLISSGEKWQKHRKLIAPTFHLSVLKTFISLFNENSRATVERMRKDIGKEFDAHDYMVETTVEILLETAMGVNKKNQDSAFNYGVAVMKMCDIIHFRHFWVWFRNDFLFSLTKAAKEQKQLLHTIHSLTGKVVREKMEEHRKRKNNNEVQQTEKPDSDDFDGSGLDGAVSFGKNTSIKDDIDDDLGEKKRVPFLEQLVEISQNGEILTAQEIKEQVDTIMFEGHDTTAAAASFFMCIMGYHADIQEKCVEELREIFGDSDRPATFHDTIEMKYLERCILETLRMFPPVPLIGRITEGECKLPSGYTLPSGTTVGILPYAIHHNEKVYPNHNVFDPDNFTPERIASRHPYAFVPFSAGPRSCVGRKYAMLKLKILLSTILRNYRLISDIPEDKYVLQADIILKRGDGFKVRVEPRK